MQQTLNKQIDNITPDIIVVERKLSWARNDKPIYIFSLMKCDAS
jgi:hypothetical protein